MNLGDLIDVLSAQDPNHMVEYGFHNPHSFRGDYSHLAFEPRKYVLVKDMLLAAKSAMEHEFEGYKGGQYLMDEWTPVHIAWMGSSRDLSMYLSLPRSTTTDHIWSTPE